MARITLESVSKTYPGNVVAVRDFTLEVTDGEFVVFVGPSGCGKTTTLRLIAGLEQVSSGTIRIADRIVNDVHPKDRDIAMVFQDYALYPHMTVRKNLSFALKLRKTPREEIERRVAETARMLGIAELLDRKPGALSGGQQQRVAVGRAVVRQPRAYLFDEPLSNLDARLRLQMRAELKSLHLRLKTTTVYVTHDQEEAMTLGDRLVVMLDGVVQQVGTPLDVYRMPANRFVAGFVGSPPMNFLTGTLHRQNGAWLFADEQDFRISLPEQIATRWPEGERRAVLGVRPEKLTPASPGGEPGERLEVDVEVTEPFGDRMDVYGTTAAGQRVVARVDLDAPCAPGRRSTFTVAADAVHLFEPGDLGRRL
ncbi:MAG: ABC transporter ATP-binding protein [Planctomycetota bacterium]|jgi:multiple sugar transport system ATP-binding protein